VKNEEFQPWLEKYRPKKLSDVIGHKDAIERLQAYVKNRNLPHLLLAGPAGIGKCVSADTLVAMADGCLERVKDVVDREFESRPSFKYLDGEAVIGKPRPACSLDKASIRMSQSEIFAYCRFPAKEIVEITLESGKKVRVTPEHPFFTPKDNSISEIRASDLKQGDFVACPRRINVQGVSVLKLPVDWEKLYSHKEYEAKESEGFIVLEPISKRSKHLRLPTSSSKELLELLGFLTGDGHVPKNASGISFFTEKPELVDRFSQIVSILFGLKTSVKKDPRRQRLLVLHVGSKVLAKFIIALGIPCGNKARIVDVPNLVSMHADAELAVYLRALFDCDGSISGKNLEYCTASPVLAEKMGLLLLRYGVKARLSTKVVSGRPYYRLSITGLPNLDAYRNSINFLALGKKARLEAAKGETNTNVDLLPPVFHHEIMRLADELHLYGRDFGGNDLAGYASGKCMGMETAQKAVAKLRSEMENRAGVLSKLLFVLNKRNESRESVVGKIKAVMGAVNKSELSRRSGVSQETLRRLRLGTHETFKSNVSRLADSLAEMGYSDFEQAKGDFDESESIRALVLDCARTLRTSMNELSSTAGISGTSYAFKYSRDFSIAEHTYEIEELAAEAFAQVSPHNIASLERLEAIVSSDIFWDRVRSASVQETDEMVYDLTMSRNSNFVVSPGIIVHNTSCILAMAHELYGDNVRECFAELNASDERGIDVVRGHIKDFARTLPMSDVQFKIILLDEADNLTDDAQQALRRTMEKYSSNTRFCLSCNYSSKIIEPIQSRCAVFRFKPLGDDDVGRIVDNIAHHEGLKLDEKARAAVVYVAAGDARKAVNVLQGASAMGKHLKEDDILAVSSRARPSEVAEMVKLALSGRFTDARKQLDELMVRYGMSGEDVISQVHREVNNLDVDDRKKVELIDRIGEYDFRMSQGADPRIQLEALLAHMVLAGKPTDPAGRQADHKG